MLDFNRTSVVPADIRKSGNKISDQLNAIIDSAIITTRNKEKGRSYLGASRLGVECSRQLQYEYMNVPKDEGRDFNGQLLRTFAVGHVFEDMLINWFKDAGFKLLTQDSEGRQFGFSVAGGKIAGHVDGIIMGVPRGVEISTPTLWEMKSMNNRSWNDTARRGLTLSKPVYATQVALYLAYMEESFTGISKNPALFTAINKDTSELYHELVPFDRELAQRMSDKAVNIIKACEADELLPRIATDRNFFSCKYCSYQDRCFNKPELKQAVDQTEMIEQERWQKEVMYE